MATLLTPMSLFEDQVTSEDSDSRLDAMKKLYLVGRALGPDQTLSNLLPFLRSHVDDSDEMLLRMSENLGLMVPSLIPGAKAFPIVDILEQLAIVEETVVRNSAVDSLGLIIQHLDGSVASLNNLLAMAKRLSSGDWFTSRVSACGVFASIYELAINSSANTTEIETELLNLFKMLADDETPMVRRGAAIAFPKFAEKVKSSEVLLTTFIPIYKRLSSDEQDSVRQLAVLGILPLAKGLKDPKSIWVNILPTFRNACVDRSWRVRQMTAKHMYDIASAVTAANKNDGNVEESNIFQTIITSYVALCRDVEGEVRWAGVLNVAVMVALSISNGDNGTDSAIPPPVDPATNNDGSGANGNVLSGGLLMGSGDNNIWAVLVELGGDLRLEVRGGVAKGVMDCCDKTICKTLSDDIILKEIQPILVALLTNDEEQDEVKIHVLRKLPLLSHLLNTMPEIVSVVTNLANYEPNWRVRESVANVLPCLGESFGLTHFEKGTNAGGNKESFLNLWLKLCVDRVSEVRAACIAGVGKISTVACNSESGASAGGSWLLKNIIGNLKPIYEKSGSYLVRNTILSIYTALCPDDKTSKQLVEEVVTLVSKAFADPVANIRVVAARGLVKICGFVDDDVTNRIIKPAIAETIKGGLDLNKEYDSMDRDRDFRELVKELNGLVG